MIKEIDQFQLEQHFSEVSEEVIKTNMPIIIKRKTEGEVVILSLKGFKAIESVFESINEEPTD